MGRLLFLLLPFCGVVMADMPYYLATIEVRNRCPDPVWPGTLGNTRIPSNGGFKLEPGESKVLEVPSTWNGTIWVRTNCDKYMNCDTGTCGNFLECAGREGEVPHTKARFILDESGPDTYFVSLLDGFNANISIYPYTVRHRSNDEICEYAGGCTQDVHMFCPPQLQVSLDDDVVACNSACNVYGNPSYCCSGMFDNPRACNVKNWAYDFPGIFKKVCPRSLTYKYDRVNAIFSCNHKTADRKYIVRIC